MYADQRPAAAGIAVLPLLSHGCCTSCRCRPSNRPPPSCARPVGYDACAVCAALLQVVDSSEDERVKKAARRKKGARARAGACRGRARQGPGTLAACMLSLIRACLCAWGVRRGGGGAQPPSSGFPFRWHTTPLTAVPPPHTHTLTCPPPVLVAPPAGEDDEGAVRVRRRTSDGGSLSMRTSGMPVSPSGEQLRTRPPCPPLAWGEGVKGRLGLVTGCRMRPGKGCWLDRQAVAHLPTAAHTPPHFCPLPPSPRLGLQPAWVLTARP